MKLIEVAMMMAHPMAVVDNTSSGTKMLGRMWRVAMRKLLHPPDRAASTYRFSFAERTLPRTSRAYAGIREIPTAICTRANPVPRIATTISASRIPGNESRMSMNREITLSTALPAYPAIKPKGIPIPAATTTAINDACRVGRVPYRTRLRISLPNWSVPIRNLAPGG